MGAVKEYAFAQQRVAELAGSKVPDIVDLAGFEKWAAAVFEIVTLGGRAASALAVQDYLAQREAHGLSSRYTPRPTGFVEPEQLFSSLQWAAGAPEQAEATPRSRAEGIVNRYVLQPARETTIVAATEDPVATRVARVPRVGACAFCLLMASRGAVYHDEQSAGREANTRFVGEGEHKFHDHCHCTTRVVWEGETYTEPAHVREAADIYAAATVGVEGTKAKLAAFRRLMAENGLGRTE